MHYWRMAFKCGNQGESLWPQCKRNSVAAITYEPVINDDLRYYSIDNFPNDWHLLAPTQKASLRRLAFEVDIGDIIFVKDGKSIIAKGIVKSRYIYNAKKVIDSSGLIWPHQIEVDWDNSFIEIEILLGGEQVTLYNIDEKVDQINILENSIVDERNETFLEGERFKSEQDIKNRNLTLIFMKKRNSDYSCEVCGFKFHEKYGDIGKNFIQAHHLHMISDGVRSNTINDIVLLCSNCHSMIHKKTPPYTVEELKNLLIKE